MMKIENNWRKLVKNYLALPATKANRVNYFNQEAIFFTKKD